MRPTLAAPVLPVMVSVSADGCDAAVRFAVAEAVRVGGGVHVVHVLDDAAGSPTRAAGVCLEAVERTRDLVGEDLTVSSEIFHGDLVAGLVALSRRSRLVVLQRTDPARRRADPRPTCVQLASRAAAPVVCVPSGWTGGATGTVTVGIDATDACVPLVRHALLEAASRGTRLRIVHVDLRSDAARAAGDIRQALAAARTGVEAVPVDVDVVNGGSPVAALLLAAESSELLVLGRHHPLAPHGSRLGAVARRVMRDASCPALLVTPSESTSSADWVFEGCLA